PRFASENLGWIEYGKEVIRENGTAFHEFVDFQYRPDPETAKKYYKSGHHAWNLGYFVTTPKFLWSLYERFVPNLAKGLKDIVKSEKFQQTLEKIYPTLEKISFDNAILESLNPKDALVISENIEWSDIGAWEALKEALENSTDKNVTQGKVMLTDTSDSLVYNYTNQTVTTIDVKGMLVVVTDDVVLVCPKGSVPKIKKFVESLSGTKNEHLV
ncbi:MAG: mannose-1-phosphate guanylyltransferase, partial [uncultured bacterium]